MSSENLPQPEKELTPEERIAASARAEAESYLEGLKSKSGIIELKFIPPGGMTAKDIQEHPENLLSESQWIEQFVNARVQMWKDSVAEAKKRNTVPFLTWDGKNWTLQEDWLDNNWGSSSRFIFPK